MKVLFAVSNDNITTSIVSKYQQKFKTIITSKNVYYFNAIIKELQNDKNYDAIVISEDLEPMSNNNYEAIDKFLIDKLDSISDEASKPTGEDIPIIFICSDRRTKSDQLLRKLFSMSIYNALVGNDRSVSIVCNLINKPRSKKEAKKYYQIDDGDQVEYEPENDELVSETQIQNILSYYKKIGNNEKKCVAAFDSIAKQYDETQLRIIVKFLPMQVKAILESKSEKYQRLMSNGTVLSNGKYNQYNDKATSSKKLNNLDFLEKDLDKPNLTKPVVIPSTMGVKGIQTNNTNTANINNMSQNVNNSYNQDQYNPNMNNPYGQNMNSYNNYNNMNMNMNSNPYNQNNTSNPYGEGMNNMNPYQNINQNQGQGFNNYVTSTPVEPIATEPAPKAPVVPEPITEQSSSPVQNQVENNLQEDGTIEPVKKKRGRPRKVKPVEETNTEEHKRGRGRPPKNATTSQTTSNTPVEVPTQTQIAKTSTSISQVPQANNEQKDDSTLDLFSMAEPELNTNNNDNYQTQSSNSSYTQNTNPSPYESVYGTNVNQTSSSYTNNDFMNNNSIYDDGTINNLIPNLNETYQNSQTTNNTGMGKVVAFVGTTKNGTSFIVNNLAEVLSEENVKTAVLDLTQNRNAYYMFTNNEANLMKTATDSIKKLEHGIVDGVKVNKNLTVFTGLPGEIETETIDPNVVVNTLSNNFDIVLMDCDFKTDGEYFVKANEWYLVQSMDAFTIQPLTKFLSDLKIQGKLDENKIRVIINKYVKLRKLDYKLIIGGMSKYNEPSMTLQRDLFDANKVQSILIPFEEQTYANYLEEIAMCELSTNGYSQNFINSLNELKNMVYPLISGGSNNNQKNYGNYESYYGESNNNNYNMNNSSVNQNNASYEPPKYGNYEKKPKRSFFGTKKMGSQTFSSDVNDTLNKMRNNNY